MKPTIAEWLKGKDILITGSTGFMGKVLVEKLLRCCDVNRLYLVIRTKRGTDPNDRLKDFIRCPLYEPLLNEKPNVFEKVTCIPGDMSELECGISKQHQAELCEKVSIVFHTAASVRFDEPLSAALKLNTRGTFELIKLAKQMPKLELFQYVSTTYCNSNLNEIVQEKVYPSHLDWKIILRLCDLEDDALDSIAYKLMGTQPNTYTLTKSLAENVVYEARKELPAVIVRPSVVTPVFHGPVPGWLSNLNGVMGVATGVSKGVLRVFKCDRNAAMDYLPADVAINGMIVAAWYKRFHSDSDEVQVFNEAYSDFVPITFQNIVDLGVGINRIYPMENYVWHPYMLLTNNTYLYHFLFFVLQLIPALFQDLLLTIARKKPMLLSLNIKIYNAAMALQRFTAKRFAFSNKKYVALTDSMTEEDKKIYDIELDAKTIDLFQTFSIAQRGVKKFIFNEKEEDMPYYKTWYWRLYYIHYGTIMIIIALAVLLITSNVSSLLWP